MARRACCIFLIAFTNHAAASDIHDALAFDGECRTSGKDCALSALQLSGSFAEPVDLLSMQASEEELLRWHNKWYGRTPGADLSTSNYKNIMANISVQQKLILGLFNESLELEQQVDPLVKRVELDSGLKVADFVALIEASADIEASRQEGSQPREAHVKKWLSYLEQEMSAVFKKLNVVDKKNAACGTLMSKNPTPLGFKKVASLLSIMAAPKTQIVPGDHIGTSDEVWRSLLSIIANIQTAGTSAANLKMHIVKIGKMIEDWKAGRLIPEKGPGAE